MSTPDRAMVKAAADAIYRKWLPLIGEAQAREQAQSFARRFHILIDGPLAMSQVPA